VVLAGLGPRRGGLRDRMLLSSNGAVQLPLVVYIVFIDHWGMTVVPVISCCVRIHIPFDLARNPFFQALL